MRRENLKSKLLQRVLEDVKIEVRKQGDKTGLSLSASSETPVERWFGTEILSHDAGAVRLDRAKAGALPLLFNHDVNDPRGMVDAASVQNKRLMIDSHLFDTPEGRQLQQMIDGGLKNVSLKYRIYEVMEDVKSEQFTVTDWEPLEVSIVTVPADFTVGVGRSADEEFEFSMNRAQNAQGDDDMTPEEIAAKKAEDDARAAADAAKTANRGLAVVDPGTQTPSAVELEQSRRKAITNLCKANKLDDRLRDMWIGQGISIEAVSEDILRVLEERGKSNPQPATRLGLTAQETQRFSLMRAIRACADQSWNLAPFELECSREVAKALRKVPDEKRFFVPFEVLQRPIERGAPERRSGSRGLDVGTSPENGGDLVSTSNQGFIEILRNRSVAFRMGVRRLSGLVGNVTVPRQNAAATAYWLDAEDTQITPSAQAFKQMALTPKTVGAYTEISRQLMLQSSPSAEAIVSDDLAQVVALAADKAVLVGSGASGEPKGITQTDGVGELVGAGNDFDSILEAQTTLAVANVMPARGGYVTTPELAAIFIKTVKYDNTASPIWDGNIWDGVMLGLPAMSSSQAHEHASLFFGDWQEAVVGEWGVLEVEVNPYANFQAGIIGVRAMYSLDVAIRRPFAFVFKEDITEGS